MWTWTKIRALAGAGRERREPRAPAKRRAFSGAAAYQPLHRYLDDRFAETVVLTFAEVEDLLGFTLPDLARQEPGWWADADRDGVPSPQARSWTEARRHALANLPAKVVSFARAAA